jgi:hypothetical protein
MCTNYEESSYVFFYFVKTLLYGLIPTKNASKM